MTFFARAGLVFALTCLVWVVPISLKYRHLTTGTAGRFNHALFSRHYHGFPYEYEGLRAPASWLGFSSWDDPSRYVLPAVDLRDPAEQAFFKQKINANLQLLLAFLNSYNNFWWASLGLAVLLALAKPVEKQRLLPVIGALLLYPLGYVLVHLEERHVWLVLLLAWALLAQLLTWLFAAWRVATPWRLAVLLAVALALVNRPARHLLDHRKLNHRALYTLSQAMAQQLPLREKNIAVQNESWHRGLFLSFFLQARFFGEARPVASEAALLAQLRQFGVEYYLVWGRPQNSLRSFTIAGRFPADDLVVYRVPLR